jgi:beta-propeller repeat-containing protein
MRDKNLRRHFHKLFITLLVLVVSALIVTPGDKPAALPGPSAKTTARPEGRQALVQSYGKLPLSFEVNRGQADPQVKFLSRGSGYALFLTGDEAVLSLRGRQSSVVSRRFPVDSRQPSKPPSYEPDTTALLHSPFTVQNSELLRPQPPAPEVLRMKLVGANRMAKVTGLEELPGKSNYFIGNDPKKWRTDVPTYAKVKYEGVYPGVDLVYYGNQRQLEYDFVVAAGADPNVITLGIETRNSKSEKPVLSAAKDRKSKLTIDANGDLIVQAEGGEVRFHKPTVYQASARPESQAPSPGFSSPKSKIENPKLLDGGYVLTADNQIRFEVPNYDKTRPLVIDPVLAYSTYLGGSTAGNVAKGIAVDPDGNAYVTGQTCASDFPTTLGAFEPSQPNANYCYAFVTKLNPNGSALLYSTYLGGSKGGGGGNAIAVDVAGVAYVTGLTFATDFPVVNAFQPNYKGDTCSDDCGDAFVTKINAAGDGLLYSTYLAGGLNSAGNIFSVKTEGAAIALDSVGSAYVTGHTDSTDFPTTANAFLPSLAFGGAFVTKFTPDGSGLVYSTYLGPGSGNGIALDSMNSAYVAGSTSSSNFPTTAGAFQTVCGGGPTFDSICNSDAFVMKLSTDGSSLVYSTYLGGSGGDTGVGVAVDSAGSAYVTGTTGSTDFPTLNAFEPALNGTSNAFVAKFTPDGSALIYSTYVGGSGSDLAQAIALDSAGNAHVTGSTSSLDFPTVDPFQPSLKGFDNAFVAELNAGGTALFYSSYLGGSRFDAGLATAVDSTRNAYVTGYTTSADFPIVNAFQSTLGPNSVFDAFVAKIAPTVQFSSFSTKLEITAGPPPGFQMYANFTLGAGGSIDPLTQPVTLQVGSYSVTIPPGSFKQLQNGSKAGSYVYSGTTNGVSLQIQIVPLGGSSYAFKVVAQPVDLTGLSNPVTVTITIGNNSGTEGANAEFQ